MSKSSDRETPGSVGFARYKFTVSYDGTLYEGFQRQGSRNTIQLALETALRTLGWTESSIIAAGRTDSGVHAEGQVFSARLNWKHGPDKLQAALNARLREDIAILSIEQADDNFHARYDALSRTYHYSIYVREQRDPLKDRFQWRVWPRPDLDALNRAAEILIGEHDFSAFGSPPRKNGRTNRTVMTSRWFQEHDGGIQFEIEANGFLYHMVRRLVYFQICFAHGRLDWNGWQRAVLNAAELLPGLAPPNGLRLLAVRYSAGDNRRGEEKP